MRVELDEDNTLKAEKAAGQLGMSVNGYVNWLVATITRVNVSEEARIETKQLDGIRRVIRRKQSWITNI